MSAGPQIGLVQACDDSQLFGVKLWPRQREILAAIERGDERLFVLCLGRRSSKTTLAALTMLWTCLLRPELREMVRSRERLYAVGVATSLRQGRLLVSSARSVVEDSPLLAPMLESSTEDELRFSNGTALAAFPCSSRAGRGWPIACLVADEMAFMLSETEGPAVADRVWTSLVPATAQFGSAARLIAASTPNGTDGLFARLFRQAQDGELSDARAFHATSAEMNPTLDPGLLALEERRDPDGFAAEYLAQFTGSGGAFLDMDRFTVSDRDYALSPEESCPRSLSGSTRHSLDRMSLASRWLVATRRTRAGSCSLPWMASSRSASRRSRREPRSSSTCSRGSRTRSAATARMRSRTSMRVARWLSSFDARASRCGCFR